MERAKTVQQESTDIAVSIVKIVHRTLILREMVSRVKYLPTADIINISRHPPHPQTTGDVPIVQADIIRMGIPGT